MDVTANKKKKWPHQGEKWINKSSEKVVTLDAMFDTNTYYTGEDGEKFKCNTEMFISSHNYLYPGKIKRIFVLPGGTILTDEVPNKVDDKKKIQAE